LNVTQNVSVRESNVGDGFERTAQSNASTDKFREKKISRLYLLSYTYKITNRTKTSKNVVKYNTSANEVMFFLPLCVYLYLRRMTEKAVDDVL